ncbi:glucosamine--fructose-6-phosphate aminotransferase (isomerizing) [Ilumatobacter fluminis]|uniref:Glutamine--fructose-6-phosphate aminotransferase [isomerizing] n=1 Tax=Ilumatobacter fluminis TaxID=467091 RepID=A0A4R7I4Z8_9ACTN|nr:SIS domain-containing protein [Ilumatobacter fluminis]TDT17816.1 glucosamine--fructose-6-phosphate aminotransferase (isomerizing) [Ilumatobacter fluminis]
MCGIVGIISRPPTRPIPTEQEILAAFDAAEAAVADPATAATELSAADRLLAGVPGALALIDRHEFVVEIEARLTRLDAAIAEFDGELDEGVVAADEVERRAAASIALRDVLWSIRHDRLRTAREVAALAGRQASRGAVAGYLAVQQSLSAIDRLEVRGRDSAGINVFVHDHGLDLDDPAVRAAVTERSADPMYQSGSLRVADGVLSFAYKAAAEIGELGDNTRVLRAAVAGDDLLRRALAVDTARVAVLGHTRWASVGIISEPNTHPLNSDELESSPSIDATPYVVAALNGDVDNHADLRVEHHLRVHPQVTTDAKIIPTLVARHAGSGTDLVESFRRTVSTFDGSVAIGAMAASDPTTMMLALNGSGQGLYVGLADDAYIVASEPYGVVEETDSYLRLDGEHGGEIVVLDAAHAGELAGLRRVRYDGSDVPVTADEIVTAQVTTRDIDRGTAPHFLVKEIGESPDSFRKTLRTKIVEHDGMLRASVGERALPPEIAARLADGSITRIRVIGQGTAAVAGQSAAAILDELCQGALDVDAITATELSGFHLRLDMSDTLAIAVSQSGTTTDTNRTVDLLRARGAAVIGIVNRRASDLVDKADGILYTSDGRDVEMSVASTKAFYAQVAAGALLACAVAEAAGVGEPRRRHDLLQGLRELPAAMQQVLAKRDEIGEAARRFAPPKRYWAVVGNGPNKVAAEEVRIKLSELCYKSIASDSTEDKKHIDLSSEPLILVCAAGLRGSTADDVAKETAIFRAHKATPIVVADEGETRFSAAATITVPPVDPALGFVLSAMVGHLFGYEAALAIDASARPLREARELVERSVADHVGGDAVLDAIRHELPPLAQRFTDGLRDRVYDGHLEAGTAVRLVGLLRDLESDAPVEAYARSSGKVGTPAALIDELVAALTGAIEELTRPVDAIKHQAKTVTVGISRSDEGIIDRLLVQATLEAGAGRDVLSYRTLKILADLSPAIDSVVGFTRYRIDGATVSILDRGGISRDLTSRVDTDSRLVGTKHRVADGRELLVARGRRDGRTVIFVPEVKAGVCTGITLLHVTMHDRLDAATMRGVLQGYDNRYARLVDWVTETEGDFDESRLGELPVDDLLIAPISDTADLWRDG